MCNLNQFELSHKRHLYDDPKEALEHIQKFVLGLNETGDKFKDDTFIGNSDQIYKTRQKCFNTFVSMSFRGRFLTWNDFSSDDPENFTIGSKYYSTDFGACCLFVPHLHFEEINGQTPDIYHEIKADALHGENNGLTLVLDAEEFNYGYGIGSAVGFRMNLHHHSDKPMFQFSSLLINTGLETHINLKPTISYTTKDAIEKFSPDQRQCYVDGEIQLNYLNRKFGYKYDMNNCLIDTAIQDIIWNCRCRPKFVLYKEITQYLKLIPFCTGKMFQSRTHYTK